MTMERTNERLKELQEEPLERKIMISQTRIIEWHTRYKGNVYVAFSGGKDSTVLLHLVRSVFPEVPAVFVNTGLEYPEIRKFALQHENVIELIPRWGKTKYRKGRGKNDVITFFDTMTIWGYPLISKEISAKIYESRMNPKSVASSLFNRNTMKDGRKSFYDYSKYRPVLNLPFRITDKCCDKLKKSPAHKFEKETGKKQFIATMASESRLRKTAWLLHGCNSFDGKNPKSSPLSFWTEQDIFAYLIRYDLPIAEVYGDIVYTDDDGLAYNARTFPLFEGKKLSCTGCKRTGCIFCAFGFHLEKGTTRFQRLKETHPRQYEYCIGGGEWKDNPDYDPAKSSEEWNPKQLWMPNRKGLGMGKVFDLVNEIYGKDFYRYE